MQSIKTLKHLDHLLSKEYTRIYLWCFGVVAFWRLLLEIVNHTFIKFIPMTHDGMPGILYGLDRWLSWDGKWYYSIFERGYTYSSALETQSNVAFFPGFPIAAQVFSWVTHLDIVYAGLLLNVLLTTFSAYFIYRITGLFAERIGTQKKNASELAPKLAVLFFLVMPSSLFLAAYYAEALLIFGISGAIYYALKNKLIAASIFAAFASSSKSLGMAVMPTILLIYFLQNQPSFQDRRKLVRQLPFYILCAVISLSGLFIYMLFLWNRFDDPLLFTHIQAQWQRNISSSFIVTIWKDYYRHLFSPVYFGGAFSYLVGLLAMLLPIGAFVFALWAGIKYRLIWIVCLVGVLILLPVSTSTLVSMNRYIYGSVPLYCLAGLFLGRPKYRQLIAPATTAMYVVLIYLTTGFLSAHYFAG